MRLRCWTVVLGSCLLAGALHAEEFSGTVLGPDGTPVARANLLLAGPPGSGRILRCVSAEDGRFALADPKPPAPAPGNPLLYVHKQGLAIALVSLPAGQSPTIRLANAEVRCGTLLGPGGRPVPAASVSIISVTAPAPGRPAQPTYLGGTLSDLERPTDASGWFCLRDLAPGMAVEVQFDAEGYERATAVLGDPAPVTVELRPEVTISGKVLLAGQPQGGAWVQAQVAGPKPSAGYAVAAADGTYRICRLAAGEVSVSAWRNENDTLPVEPVLLNLKAGQAATNIDFNLLRGAVVQGRITAAGTGQPVERALVYALAADGTERYAAVGEEGRYELRLPAGSYRLLCSAPFEGKPSAAGVAAVALGEGETLTRDFTVRLGRTVGGQVLLPDGQPARAATLVGAGLIGGGPTALDDQACFRVLLPADTAQKREWSLLFVARERSQNLAGLLSCTLASMPETLRGVLKPAAGLTATVSDPQGRPVRGLVFSVTYQGEGQCMPFATAASGDDGTVALGPLPAGVTLRIFVHGPLARLVIAPETLHFALTLEPGEQRVLPPIVLDPEGRSLNVFTGDAAGRPVAGASVYVSGREERAVSDEQGKVRLVGLPARGRVMLLAVHPRERWYAAAYADPTGGPWPGLLLQPPGSATGRLLNQLDGRPLAGATVSLRPSSGSWEVELPPRQAPLSTLRAGAGTDGEGRWHVSGLVAGMCYEVLVSPAGGGEVDRPAGLLTATGGPDEQDAGVMKLPAGGG